MDMQLGDIGTILRLTVYDKVGALVDLGSATTMRFYLKPPSGVVKTKTAVLSGDGSDGKMQYTTIQGDIDATGQWNIQGYIVFTAGRKYKTTVRNFEVLANVQ